MGSVDDIEKHEANINILTEKYEEGFQKLKKSLHKLKECVDRLSVYTEDMKNENI